MRCLGCGLFLLLMIVRSLFVFYLLLILFRIVLCAICCERVVPSAFHMCCFNLKGSLGCACSFSVWCWGGMWNWIASAPDHCLFAYFSQSTQASLMDVLYTVHRLLLEHFNLKNNYIFPLLRFLLNGLWENE